MTGVQTCALPICLPLTRRYRVPKVCLKFLLVIQKYFPSSLSRISVMWIEPFAITRNLFLSSILLPCPRLNHATLNGNRGTLCASQWNQTESPTYTVMFLGFHSVDSEDRNLLIFQLIFNLIDSSIPDEFSDLTPQRSIMNFQTKDKNRTSHWIYTNFFLSFYIQ